MSKPATRRGIRRGADEQPGVTIVDSRHIPNDVKRAVERRDNGQCAFVAADGHRCTERTFLEFHHVIPHAKGGRATVDNISLRCRRHNQYEAELVFGSRPAARRQKEQRTRPQMIGGLPAEARSLPPTP